MATAIALLEEAVDDFNKGLTLSLGWVSRVEKLLDAIEQG
jgi:hypothetical protein